MAVIGTLSVNLLANTRQFEKGVDRSRKATKDFGMTVSRLQLDLKGLNRVANAQTLFAGFRRLTQLFQSNVTDIDLLGATAAKLGINVEALQRLRFAAKQVNIEQSTLDTALQRFTRRLGEVAATGKGEAAPAFDRLGLSAQRLSRLPIEQQLSAVSNALSRLRGRGEQIPLIFKFFDTEGVALVNLLGDGADKFERLTRSFDKLGVSITSKEVANVGELVQNLNELRATGSQVIGKLVADFTPDLIRLINDIKIAVVPAAKTISETFGASRDLGTFLGNAFTGTADDVQRAGVGLRPQQRERDRLLADIERRNPGITQGLTVTNTGL